MSKSRSGEPIPIQAMEPAESESLRRLKAGEIGLDNYLDERVENALTHLKGRISPEDLESIRSVLRAKVQYDPVLVEMIHRTTGLKPHSFKDLKGN